MIINKILTLIIITFFSAIFSFAIWSDLHSVSQKIDGIKMVDLRFQKVLALKNIIGELQKERGLSTIYVSNSDKKVLKLLQKQREATALSMQKSHLQTNDFALSDNLQDVYTLIADRTVTTKEVFQRYTDLIMHMIVETKKLLLYTSDVDIKNNLLIYNTASFIQEYLGELRATVGAILAKKKLDIKDFSNVIELNTLMQNYIVKTRENIDFVDANVKLPLQKNCFKEVHGVLEKLGHQDLKDVKISPISWFNISTCAIDTIRGTMNKHLKNVQKKIEDTCSQYESEMHYHAIFWIFTVLISIVLSIILYRTNKKMHSEQKILEDYKKAIDASTIVSKTDKKGIITYVNEAFCNISGYTREELVGKPHNIVRHPDVPKEVFAEVWGDLKKGKVWQGQIINLKKDKTPYWVYATISPIYDDKDHLLEYIAIRHDITEIVELSKEIKNTQYELIYRMGESVESRSKESGHHIQRVAHYSKLLAEYACMSSQDAETIFIASTMHDMGKIAIPDSILLKNGKLDREEWEIMKTHAAIGHKILEGSNLPILKMAADIAYEHHEHYNGDGYPRGIKGEEISIAARIVAIADVFDALISERVYKKAWPLEKVLKLFKEESGKQFDPELTQLFLAHTDAFMEIKEKFED